MMRRLRADALATSVTAIDVAALRARGIDGAIIDLDNTLVGYRALEPSAADARWIAEAAASGFRIVIVTNNATPWAQAVAKGLGVPCVGNARKPLPRGFRRALDVLELPRERVVVIGDQFFTDVLGAKFFGLPVILVPPLGDRDPLNTRPLRWLARLLRVERR
jgi:HAD superfamily phosphatase (TIGR01668 family)